MSYPRSAAGNAAFDGGAGDGPAHRASMRECFAHTDLEWRLTQIPDFAACRGVFFNMLDERAAAINPAVQREYRQFFQLYHFSPLRMYPVRDYLTRLVVLAQIQYGGEEIPRGIYETQAAAYPTWKRTLMGRAMFAVLGNDFAAVLRAIERTYATRSFVNYCTLKVRSDRPGSFVVSFGNEYVYLEHAMRGALAGVAEACNVEVELSVHLRGPLDGEIGIVVRP